MTATPGPWIIDETGTPMTLPVRTRLAVAQDLDGGRKAP
jgi:hypothetical protein